MMKSLKKSRLKDEKLLDSLSSHHGSVNDNRSFNASTIRKYQSVAATLNTNETHLNGGHKSESRKHEKSRSKKPIKMNLHDFHNTESKTEPQKREMDSESVLCHRMRHRCGDSHSVLPHPAMLSIQNNVQRRFKTEAVQRIQAAAPGNEGENEHSMSRSPR